MTDHDDGGRPPSFVDRVIVRLLLNAHIIHVDNAEGIDGQRGSLQFRIGCHYGHNFIILKGVAYPEKRPSPLG